MDLIDALVVLPVDSASIEKAFHVQGVNMRYLGSVYHLTASPHIRDVCCVEMTARTLKRILNTQISDQILARSDRHRGVIDQLAKVEN